MSVRDEGIGLTDQEINKLFQKFSRIHREGVQIKTEGTGLGLYISKKIVELHRGQIWAESKGRNKGSTFYITLPLK